MFLWRPILAEGKVGYTQADLKQWVTISDVLDAHEALDLIEASREKVEATNARR